MSVEIILSAKQIQLDSNNQAVLNLKATFSRVLPTTSALYKIRTNFKDVMDVRPSFGVLRGSTEEGSIACLNIKYSGSIDDITKMKIQVSWVWGDNVPEKKLGHNEFNELYKAFKESINKEKSHMVQFTTQHLLKLSQESIDSHQKSSASSEAELEKEMPEQKQQQILHSQPVIKPSQYNIKKVGFKVLLVGVLIAFAIGVLTGLKLQRLLQSKHSENRAEEFLSVSSFTPKGQDVVAGSSVGEQMAGQNLKGPDLLEGL